MYQVPTILRIRLTWDYLNQSLILEMRFKMEILRAEFIFQRPLGKHQQTFISPPMVWLSANEFPDGLNVGIAYFTWALISKNSALP